MSGEVQIETSEKYIIFNKIFIAKNTIQKLRQQVMRI